MLSDALCGAALKTATRTAYKSASRPASARKLHSWNFNLKMKTFLRALGLQMSHALYVPTACNPFKSGGQLDHGGQFDQGPIAIQTIGLLRLNEVRLSSFTGVLAIKYDVPFPFFEGTGAAVSVASTGYQDCSGSSSTGSVGALSDVSSRACTDDEEELLDTDARCQIRESAESEVLPLIADWCKQGGGAPRKWICQLFGRLASQLKRDDNNSDNDSGDEDPTAAYVSAMELHAARERCQRWVETMTENVFNPVDEEERCKIIFDWPNQMDEAKTADWGGVRIGLAMQLSMADMQPEMMERLAEAKTQLRDFLTSEQMEFFQSHQEAFGEFSSYDSD